MSHTVRSWRYTFLLNHIFLMTTGRRMQDTWAKYICGLALSDDYFIMLDMDAVFHFDSIPQTLSCCHKH